MMRIDDAGLDDSDFYPAIPTSLEEIGIPSETLLRLQQRQESVLTNEDSSTTAQGGSSAAEQRSRRSWIVRRLNQLYVRSNKPVPRAVEEKLEKVIIDVLSETPSLDKNMELLQLVKNHLVRVGSGNNGPQLLQVLVDRMYWGVEATTQVRKNLVQACLYGINTAEQDVLDKEIAAMEQDNMQQKEHDPLIHFDPESGRFFGRREQMIAKLHQSPSVYYKTFRLCGIFTATLLQMMEIFSWKKDVAQQLQDLEFAGSLAKCEPVKESLEPIITGFIDTQSSTYVTCLWRPLGNDWLSVYCPEMKVYEGGSVTEDHMFFKIIGALCEIWLEHRERCAFLLTILDTYRQYIFHPLHVKKEPLVKLSYEFLRNGIVHQDDRLKAIQLMEFTPLGKKLLLKLHHIGVDVSADLDKPGKVGPFTLTLERDTNDIELSEIVRGVPLHNLRTFNGKNSRITSMSIAILQQMKNLTLLCLDNTRIYDFGLHKLANALANLEKLSFKNCQITSRSIKFLARMTSLKSLDMRGTNTTKRDHAFLQKELPSTKIQFDDDNDTMASCSNWIL